MNDNSLFIGCNGHVAAIDVRTGSELWRTKLSTGFLSASSNQQVSVIDHEGRVYAACNGQLFCLDARSGELVWENPLKGLGYNQVTLAIGGKSVQFVSGQETGSSFPPFVPGS